MNPNDPEARARRRAVVLAGHEGATDLPRRSLRDADAAVRAAALAALDRAGDLREPELAAGLGDDAAEVRRRAARLAATRADAGAALAALLDDADDSVVEVAAFANGERPGVDMETLTRLVEVARTHSDSLCREAAVAALGSLGDPAGLPAVLGACGDKATVRRRAVLALAAFDGEEVTAMLVRLVDDRDLQVRQAAEELLAIEQ
ncbi:MAG: HEAT repeat domain-containing protein, partial [Microthrixaceae bacterium]